VNVEADSQAEAGVVADMIVSDCVMSGRHLYRDRPALIGDNVTWTYGELADRVERLAGVLVRMGAHMNDRIALLSHNGPAVIEVLLAAARIGAAVVLLNHRLAGPEVAFQIDDSNAVLAVVHSGLDDLAAKGGLLGRPHLFLDSDLDGHLEATSPLAGSRPGAEAVLIQLYTSGTTGRPKGCLLSQRNWVAAATSFANAYDINANDVVLTALPLFHVAALSWTLSTLLSGGTVVLPERFAVEAFWDLVTRHGVTVVAAPFGVRPALKHPAAAGSAGTLRMMVGPPTRLAGEVIPHVEMVSGYGATELCGQVTAIRGEDHRARPQSIGRLMTGYAAAVVDATDQPVRAGETGELIVRGPSMSRGYWQLPEATAALLRDGWLRTGDLVRVDEEGFFYFVDRLKDMIKTGGENVYSAEVEAVLLAHPLVREAAVLGVPDERWGQAVKAVVVPGDGDVTVAVAELDAWCLDRLAAYKRPRWYEMVDQLPRNASGKVVKPHLLAAHDPAAATRLAER
jgi:acyl-CoA synthetase (AMP-forming)/AMP-acid ligase II